MQKKYFMKVLIIFLLHFIRSELSLKFSGINQDFVVKLICSVQKFHNQFDNIQSLQRNSNDRLQSLFLITLKNFVVNSVNLDALISRLVKRRRIISKTIWNLYKYDSQFPIHRLKFLVRLLTFPCWWLCWNIYQLLGKLKNTYGGGNFYFSFVWLFVYWKAPKQNSEN